MKYTNPRELHLLNLRKTDKNANPIKTNKLICVNDLF